MVSKEQFETLFPGKDHWHGAVLAAMERFAINTPQRVAAFLAQVGHESGGLRHVREIASGQAYEGRADLGNTQPGDGTRFRGRGLIQITGRANYTACSEALGIDCVAYPEVLERPDNAALSAAWFWASRKLNILADENTPESFRKITKRINGGLNGLPDRLARWYKAQSVLLPTTSTEPVPMAVPLIPLATALLPSLIQHAPDLARIFTNKAVPVSERNLEAATKVLEIAQDVTGAANAQAAAEKIAAEPQAAEAFKVAVGESWLMLQDAASVKEARVFAERHADTRYGRVLEVVTYVAMSFLGLANLGVVIALSVAVANEAKIVDSLMNLGSMVVQADIGAALTAFGFWLGASAGRKEGDR